MKSSLSESCQKLTPYGVIARYPGGQLDLDQTRVQQVLAWTKTLRDAVRQCLGLDTESTDNPNSSNIEPSQRSPS